VEPEHVILLAETLEVYYPEDLAQIADIVGFTLPCRDSGVVDYMALAKTLLLNPELGRNKDFLAALVSSLESRNDRAIASTDWERRDYHYGMRPRIQSFLQAMGVGATPTEVTVKSNSPFTAKAEVRDVLSTATTPVMVVDNYIGILTLDCVRVVSHPLRILTGAREEAIEKGFDRALKEFRAEGREIEVRRHPKLHDRYIILNDRCWLIGSSLKDAGKKMFSMIEAADTRETIIKDVEQKWQEATEYQP
jgi:hypothetical protein